MNFSVEIHHGGVFCGIGADRAYFGSQSNWFDYVDPDSWSYFWIDEFIMLLGYGFSPSNLKVYWLLPGKELSDGLRILASDEDTQMMRAVSDKVKNIVLFFCNTRFIKGHKPSNHIRVRIKSHVYTTE